MQEKKHHHHKDTSVKTESDGFKINMQSLSWLITILAVVYTGIKGFHIYIRIDPDTFFIVRQTAYIIIWWVIAGFFMTYAFHLRTNNKGREEMRDMAKKALITSFACALKFILVTIHIFPMFFENDKMRIQWNIGEMTVWIVFTLFFFAYYKQCKTTAEKMERKNIN